MDKISIPKIYKRWPIVLDEQGFRRLYDEVNKLLGEDASVSFTIHYSDHSTFDTESLDKLVNDENRQGRRITEVAVIGSKTNKAINISFGRTKLVKDEKKYYSYIYLDVTGPDRQWVFVTQSQIEDRLKSFKSSQPSSIVVMVITVAIVSGLALLIAYLQREHLRFLYSYDQNTKSSVLNGIFFLLLFLINLSIVIPVVLLYKDITFAIGAEVEKHQDRIKKRSQLFWAVIVGIPVAILASLILK